jgi:hypothetical protein
MKPPLQNLRRLALCLLLPLSVSSGATSADQTTTSSVTLADDGYHFAAWADRVHDTSFTEWWYFNVFDAQAGVKAIFSYFVFNPKDILRLGQVQMVAVAYTDQGTLSAIDQYPMGAFSASDAQADVTIGTNSVRVQPDGTYLISGASRDQRLTWNLVYAPESEPWFAANRITVGRLPWEQMSWLVAMPRARVTGEIKVHGRNYAIDAPGYHDHNWGEWIPTDGMWTWAQYSDRRLNLEVGDFIGKPAGVVSLELDGERSSFDPDQYLLVHTHWGWDSKNRVFYPTESVLNAEKDNLRLRVNLKVLESEPLRGDLPLLPKDLIIYEQTAWYEGRVWEWQPHSDRPGGGRWRVKARIRGPGFKEWTGKHH